VSELQNFIDNSWVAPDLALPGILCDSNSGEVLAPQSGSSAAQVEAALASAQRAYLADVWNGLGAEKRAQKLDQIAASLSALGSALAHQDSLQTGVVINSTEKVAFICAAAFRGAAALLREPLRTEPLAGPHGDLLLKRLPLKIAVVIAP